MLPIYLDSCMTPVKLALLHSGEEALRAKSLARIAEHPDMAAHLAMIGRCMDLIYALLPSVKVQDANQLALGNMGIRVFNALAASIKLMMAGYYQASALQLRDILETIFLLDHFSTNVNLVTRWRSLSEKDRKREFKPTTVRTALDSRDGFTENRRTKAYDPLCKLAGHVTPEGFIMLIPAQHSNNVHCGPFLENRALEATLFEAAKLATQSANAFSTVIANVSLDHVDARIAFLEDSAKWFDQFFSAKTDNTKIAEMRSLLAAARSAAT